MKPLLIAAALVVATTAAQAEVVDSAANGFEVRREALINAPANKVYAALTQPAAWWNKDHTWSGSAANLSLAPMSGGCFCERLANGGSVLHMTVVYAQPGQALRLQGGLGPLQATGASGTLAWTLSDTNGQTTLVQTYDVGGYMKGGLDQIAPAVDRVLSEQFDRLKLYVESGKAQ